MKALSAKTKGAAARPFPNRWEHAVRRPLLAVLGCLLAAASVAAAAPASAAPAAAAEPGYTTLFDGTQAGLDAWRQAGPGGFTLQPDGSIASYGGMGLLWYPAETFADYSLKLDWKMPGDDNGGVFIGFADPQGDPWRPVNEGHEIQIDASDASTAKTTGAVYGFSAPDLAARDAALNPPGEWNTYEITVTGTRIRVYLNGVQVNDFTSPRAIADGHIGVQNDGAGLDISYRNIRIKETAGGDLARDRPVTVSSVEYGDVLIGANAVDGNPATRWGSRYTDHEWITVDLGAERSISRVRLNWEVAYASAYQVQTSPDGTTWTTVHNTTTGDGGVDDLTVTGTGRYVRVDATARGTQWGYSLWDLEVYGG
jgi:hypothetical protein